jgi:hypothetical protein
MYVIQHGTGPALELHQMFGGYTKSWAESHGCKYRFSSEQTNKSRSPHWEKPLFVRRIMNEMEEGEAGLWMDPDTFVVQRDKSPVNVLGEWADFAMVYDRATPFNSGLFFFRNNERMRKYFDCVNEKGQIDGSGYYDQSRICAELPHHPIRFQVLSWEWNSAHCTDCFRIRSSGVEPIVLACHGHPKDYVKWAFNQQLKKKRVTLQGA